MDEGVHYDGPVPMSKRVCERLRRERDTKDEKQKTNMH